MSGLSANYHKGLEQPQFVKVKKRMLTLLRKQAKISRELERLRKAFYSNK